nr:MAG TPA: hypothetical protein [Caudoviricetes sp.]
MRYVVSPFSFMRENSLSYFIGTMTPPLFLLQL